jgi:hypothetical protein
MTGDEDMAKDATSVTAKWQQNASNATQAYKDGIASVNVAPGTAAARQKNAYVQGVQSNADTWAKNVSSVSLPEWQAAASGKGGDRFAGGIAAGAPKMAQFMQNFLPKVQAISNSLPPRGTLEQNIARMTQQVRETAKLRGQV